MSKNMTWLELNARAIVSNIKEIKKRIPVQTKFMAVIKANAYGHGLLEVAKIVENSCDYLAVFDFNDAVFLRQKKIKTNLFVLGPTIPEQFALAAKHNIEITISSLENLQKAIKYHPIILDAKRRGSQEINLQKNELMRSSSPLESRMTMMMEEKLSVHICADTGMGRDGFVLEDMEKVVSLLKNKKNLEVKGLYAHFASADEKAFDNYTKKQLETLQKWRKEFSKINLNPIVHHAASAGSIKGFGLDMARSGCVIYGLWPSLEMRDDFQNKLKLKPALTWKVKIAEVRNLKKGDCISYNCTHVLKRDSKLATLPIGYWDGIPRSSSGKGWFLVKGRKVPQIGRVTMNMAVLDVTDVAGVKAGDVVTVIGKDGKNSVSAEDWGTWSGTINYEITTRINPLIERPKL